MNEPEASTGPAATAEADEEKVRQRRKEKIMASREDRLAKIMTMTSGRTVDPKEIHIDRTPSPSISEKAAAGIGELEVADDDSNVLLLYPSTASSPLNGRQGRGNSAAGNPAFHLLTIIVSAVLFYFWHLAAQGRFGPLPMISHLSSFTPSYLLFGSFLTVEMIEFTSGRVSVTGIMGDFALYLWIILILIKVY